MWHVFEHVPDPAQMLAEVRRLLKPASVLIVAVPLNDNLETQWFGANWASNDGLRHLVTFTRSSLLLLAEQSGFRLEKQKGVA
jgi:2-polyprenyl-3-methyl-5-hydroxy-6-metoxy-1,4-benzoquinol methylase